MKKKITTITQKIFLPALPKEVYDAFLDSKKHSDFTDLKATGKGFIG